MPAAPSPVAVQAQRWRPTAALSRGRSLDACALLRGMGVGLRLGPPLPPRKPSPPRRPPRQQSRALALIWYHLPLGQSPDASAQVTPAPPCRSDHPPARLAAGGSTRPTPGRWSRCAATRLSGPKPQTRATWKPATPTEGPQRAPQRGPSPPESPAPSHRHANKPCSRAQLPPIGRFTRASEGTGAWARLGPPPPLRQRPSPADTSTLKNPAH
jgi:hypothetical protein